jgi:hypothetical protein
MTQKLTAEKIEELWGKTYNTKGKPDWSHIFPYYHEEIVFQDSIQRIRGLENFKEMCIRLTDRCKELSMEIETVVLENNIAFFQWKMVMMFKRFPSTPMFGTTKLTFGQDNLIIEQRDYYDVWGDIFNGIPRFNNQYRKFMARYFG